MTDRGVTIGSSTDLKGLDDGEFVGVAVHNPTSPQPRFDDATLVFSQEPDCCDPQQNGDQRLEIRVMDGGAGPYFVLKTERWAVCGANELMSLLDRCKAALQALGADQ